MTSIDRENITKLIRGANQSPVSQTQNTLQTPKSVALSENTDETGVILNTRTRLSPEQADNLAHELQHQLTHQSTPLDTLSPMLNEERVKALLSSDDE